MIKPTATGLMLLAGLAAGSLPLRGSDLDPVAVSSTTSVDYVRGKLDSGAPKPETYLFFQGKFFGGTTRDPNLERAQFNDIAQTLAKNLVKQEYYPTKDQKNADLLLVVHWGATTVYENPNRHDDLDRKQNAVLAEQAAGPSTDHAAVNLELAIGDLEQRVQENSLLYNARLLGYSQELTKDQSKVVANATRVTSNEASLYLDLNEERYFVILMAYDFHTMKKGVRPKLLWSTRFSIRAPGNSFTASLPVMSRVAADYYGQAVDGLKFEKTNTPPEGKVEVGVPTVVGSGK
jgi:hypothetical protein